MKLPSEFMYFLRSDYSISIWNLLNIGHFWKWNRKNNKSEFGNATVKRKQSVYISRFLIYWKLVSQDWKVQWNKAFSALKSYFIQSFLQNIHISLVYSKRAIKPFSTSLKVGTIWSGGRRKPYSPVSRNSQVQERGTPFLSCTQSFVDPLEKKLNPDSHSVIEY